MLRTRILMAVLLTTLTVGVSQAQAASLSTALGIHKDVLDGNDAAALALGRISNNVDIDVDVDVDVDIDVESGGSGGGSGGKGCPPPKFNHCGKPIFPVCPSGVKNVNNVNVVVNVSIEIIVKFITSSCLPPASPSRCCRCFGF